MKPAYSEEMLGLRRMIDAYLLSGREDDMEQVEAWSAIVLISVCSSSSLLFLAFGNYINRQPEKRELVKQLLQTGVSEVEV